PVHRERDHRGERDHGYRDADHEPHAGKLLRGAAGASRVERPAIGVGVAHHGSTRCTGLPLMSTDQVVVSLPWFTLYSISHQPSAAVPSLGGLRPSLPYVAGSGMVIVISRLLNCAAPLTAVWIWLTPVCERPSSEDQSKVW